MEAGCPSNYIVLLSPGAGYVQSRTFFSDEQGPVDLRCVLDWPFECSPSGFRLYRVGNLDDDSASTANAEASSPLRTRRSPLYNVGQQPVYPVNGFGPTESFIWPPPMMTPPPTPPQPAPFRVPEIPAPRRGSPPEHRLKLPQAFDGIVDVGQSSSYGLGVALPFPTDSPGRFDLRRLLHGSLSHKRTLSEAAFQSPDELRAHQHLRTMYKPAPSFIDRPWAQALFAPQRVAVDPSPGGMHVNTGASPPAPRRQPKPRKKPAEKRWFWPDELHQAFVVAYDHYNGEGTAKDILELMIKNGTNVGTLTVSQVRSHAQKHKLRLQKIQGLLRPGTSLGSGLVATGNSGHPIAKVEDVAANMPAASASSSTTREPTPAEVFGVVVDAPAASCASTPAATFRKHAGRSLTVVVPVLPSAAAPESPTAAAAAAISAAAPGSPAAVDPAMPIIVPLSPGDIIMDSPDVFFATANRGAISSPD